MPGSAEIRAFCSSQTIEVVSSQQIMRVRLGCVLLPSDLRLWKTRGLARAENRCADERVRAQEKRGRHRGGSC